MPVLPRKQEHKQGSDAFGVADLAPLDKSGYLLRGNRDQLDVFGILSHQTTGHQVGSQEAVQVLCAISGRGRSRPVSLSLGKQPISSCSSRRTDSTGSSPGSMPPAGTSSRTCPLGDGTGALEELLVHRGLLQLRNRRAPPPLSLFSCRGFLYGVHAYVHRAPLVDRLCGQCFLWLQHTTPICTWLPKSHGFPSPRGKVLCHHLNHLGRGRAWLEWAELSRYIASAPRLQRWQTRATSSQSGNLGQR